MTKAEILKLPELTREAQCAQLHEWDYDVKCSNGWNTLCEWCYGPTVGKRLDIARRESFWDLAGRLRDEVIKADLKNETSWWCEASYEVFLHTIGEENERDEVGLDTWFAMYAQSIHMISAALLAKLEASKGE